MQYKIFSIPILNGEEEQENLNKFLRSVRVVESRKELVTIDAGCFWTFCVSFLPIGKTSTEEPKNTREDTARKREQLLATMSDEEKERFEAMSAARTILSNEEALPAFRIFTNKELAFVAKAGYAVLERDDVPPEVEKSHWKYYARRLWKLLNTTNAGSPEESPLPFDALMNEEERQPF